MSYEDINTFRDEIPLFQQRLPSREVESPAIEPGLPRREDGHFKEGLKDGTVREKGTRPSSHGDQLPSVQPDQGEADSRNSSQAVQTTL